MTIDVVEALRHAELFRDLSDPLLSALADKAIVKGLSRDEILFVMGEPAKGLYVIASGSVRAYRTASDGREQVIHTERSGATIGELPLFDNQPYPSTAAAEEDSVGLVETLSLRAVGQRLAQWFLNEARTRGRELDQGIEIELALSREQMAARVGSVREVVSRAISRLDQEGLVRVEGHRVLIPDIQRLAEYIEHT